MSRAVIGSLIFLFIQNAAAANVLAIAANKLNEATSSKMAVKKTVFNAFTEETKSYEGEIQVSHKSLRLDYAKPEKSMILVGETEIWVVNYDAGSANKISQILHVQAKKNKAHQLLLTLLGGDGLMKKFKVLKKTDGVKQSTFNLRPTMTIDEIEKIEVLIDTEKEDIKKITYWDESENKTEYELSEITYNSGKVNQKIFQFKPPKGAKVEELTDTESK